MCARGLFWGTCCWSAPLLLFVLALALASSASAQDCPKLDAQSSGALNADVLLDTGRVVDVVWAGEDASVVFALTESTDNRLGGRLWRSERGGVHGTWADVTKQLAGSTPETPEAMASSDYGVLEIQIHPIKRSHIFFRGIGKFHWTSTDGGHTFTQVRAPGLGGRDDSYIRLHPTEENWLLMLVRRPWCSGANNQRNPLCGKDLFVTTDFGMTFKNLTAESGRRSKGLVSFVDYDWGYKVLGDEAAAEAKADAGGTGGKYSLEPRTILATAYESREAVSHGNAAMFRGWDSNVHFVRTDDMFDNYEHVVSCGNQFEVLNRVVFLAVAADCPVALDVKGSGKFHESTKVDDTVHAGSSSIMLYTSTDLAKTFEQACLPINVEDRGYTFRDAGDGAVFITVDHDEEDAVERQAPMGNVYLSGGSKFALFSLSLPRVHYKGAVDLTAVEGVHGVFLANQLDEAAYDDPALLDRRTSFENYLATKISFNKGARWDSLRAPETDANGQPVVCHTPGACPLHVHSMTSWASSAGNNALVAAYSSKSAPGIIMATGNIGRYLSFQRRDVNTYISRDAGHTWQEVRKGAHVFEYGDHGGAIVMAQHAEHGPTDEIFYSLDGGRCWEAPIVLDEMINLDNIRIEPKGASSTFIVHGTQCTPDVRNNRDMKCRGDVAEGRKQNGVIFTLDLQSIKPRRQCKHPTDFEMWSPASAHCIVGMNTTYERVKAHADCFVGEAYERKSEQKPCECDWSDVMCDYGSKPKYGIFTGVCEPIPGLGRIATKINDRSKYGHAGDGIRGVGGCPIVDRGEYTASTTGMRLITGDTCTGIENYINDTDGNGKAFNGPRIDNRSRGSSLGRFLITLLILGLIGAALFVSWTRVLTQSQRNTVVDSVREALANPVEGAKRLLGMSRSPFSRPRVTLDEEDLGSFQPLAADGLGLDDIDDNSAYAAAP